MTKTRSEGTRFGRFTFGRFALEDLHLIDARARGFGLSLAPTAREGIARYLELLLQWGERINLTAARSVVTLIAEHLPDAFAIAARLEFGGGTRETLIDAGSGGGLPAIPLALLRPVSEVTLVEATGKKVAFLRTAVRELGLGNRVAVEHRRIGPLAEDAGRFDVATSRAMLAPREWLALGRLLVRPGGVVFCLGARALGDAPEGMQLVQEACYRPDRWVAELRRST
jgi:16S rRNA (guanine527-N7)-methyltransferase